MKDIEISVPNIKISTLENFINKIKQIDPNCEISFEVVIGNLFPASWKNILADLNRQYTKGYIQGYKEGKQYSLNFSSQDDDSDCYCE